MVASWYELVEPRVNGRPLGPLGSLVSYERGTPVSYERGAPVEPLRLIGV